MPLWSQNSDCEVNFDHNCMESQQGSEIIVNWRLAMECEQAKSRRRETRTKKKNEACLTYINDMVTHRTRVMRDGCFGRTRFENRWSSSSVVLAATCCPNSMRLNAPCAILIQRHFQSGFAADGLTNQKVYHPMP